MSDSDQRYQALAQGASADELHPHEERVMLSRALQAAESEALEEREAGLRVAAAIGGREASPVIGRFLSDPSPQVRGQALQVARDLRMEGLPLIRQAAGGSHEDLALEALRLLLQVADRGSASLSRRLLRSTSAPVRALAAELLGHVAGVAVRQELERLQEDPDEQVRQAASAAVQRVGGRLPRKDPEPWWEVAPSRALVPADEAHMPEAPPPEPTDAPPPRLTTAEVGAWLAELGACRKKAQRAALIERLKGADEALVARAVREAARASDPRAGRGAAVLTAALQQTAWAGAMRTMLNHRDPDLRRLAAEALGMVGRGAAVLGPLSALLSDAEAPVRGAAARAVARVCRGIDRPELAVQRLAPLEKDPAEEVRLAREDALSLLEAP